MKLRDIVPYLTYGGRIRIEYDPGRYLLTTGENIVKAGIASHLKDRDVYSIMAQGDVAVIRVANERGEYSLLCEQ